MKPEHLLVVLVLLSGVVIAAIDAEALIKTINQTKDSKCQQIENQTLRDVCYLSFAKEEIPKCICNDYVCSRINDLSMKSECLSLQLGPFSGFISFFLKNIPIISLLSIISSPIVYILGRVINPKDSRYKKTAIGLLVIGIILVFIASLLVTLLETWSRFSCVCPPPK